MTETPFPIPAEEVTEQHASPAPAADISANTEVQKSLLDSAVDETIRKQVQSHMTEEERWKLQQRYAKAFATSGIFDDLKGKTPDQAQAAACVKILLGQAIGLEPMEAMQSIYFVKGRPTLDAQVRASRMKRHGYDWRFVQHDEKGCVLKLMRRGEVITDDTGKECIVAFVEEDRKRAGLDGDNWKKYPKNMFFARAITNAQRWYAPEVLNGAALPDPSEDREEDPRAPAKPVFRKPDEPEAAK